MGHRVTQLLHDTFEGPELMATPNLLAKRYLSLPADAARGDAQQDRSCQQGRLVNMTRM